MTQKVTTVKQTNSQLNTDYQKITLLMGNNEFAEGEVTASGSDVDLVVGMVMGRVSATGKLVPLLHSASDGSQYPAGLCWLGVNYEDTVTDGTTKTINVVNKGRVNKNLINFGTASTLNSVVSGRRLSDWLMDLGLILEATTELTGFAN